jgi:prepilin-type processing-associated H-X9-DG protein
LRILAINSGASYSTADVHNGYVNAWKADGHTVAEYALDRRLTAATKWLKYQYRQAGPGAKRPTPNDVAYLASFEAFIKALAHDVDWVVVTACLQFHPGVFHAMRKGGLKCAVILTESPYQDAEQVYWASLANVTFTNERTSVPYLSQYCHSVHYLPHAYDPDKHFPGAAGPEVPEHDVVFVGTDWPERIELFGAVDWSGIDFGLYGFWRTLGSRHRLRRHLRAGVVDNAMTAALYRQAAIGLNPYRQSVALRRGAPRITTAESLNPRAVELAACGCFSICDDRPEVKEVFGELVPTYRTPEELEELIRYYLAHPQERADLAAELHQRVQDRTFAALGRRVITTLEEYDGKTFGPPRERATQPDRDSAR